MGSVLKSTRIQGRRLYILYSTPMSRKQYKLFEIYKYKLNLMDYNQETLNNTLYHFRYFVKNLL